jgi:hypothetical protein
MSTRDRHEHAGVHVDTIPARPARAMEALAEDLTYYLSGRCETLYPELTREHVLEVLRKVQHDWRRWYVDAATDFERHRRREEASSHRQEERESIEDEQRKHALREEL